MILSLSDIIIVIAQQASAGYYFVDVNNPDSPSIIWLNN